MRSPGRNALYCLVALLASAGLIRLGIGRGQKMGEHWTSSSGDLPPDPAAVKIRTALAADIEAMHALRRRVTENALSDPRRVTEDSYLPYLARGGAWVAETESGLAGFAILDVAGASVWALFVAPEWEGLGVGRALLERLVEAAIGHGLRRLFLSTAPLTRAERFYTAAGWTRIGTTAAGELSFARNLVS
jgi:GNAT superfamily N-acetyltransferase